MVTSNIKLILMSRLNKRLYVDRTGSPGLQRNGTTITLYSIFENDFAVVKKWTHPNKEEKYSLKYKNSFYSDQVNS